MDSGIYNGGFSEIKNSVWCCLVIGTPVVPNASEKLNAVLLK